MSCAGVVLFVLLVTSLPGIMLLPAVVARDPVLSASDISALAAIVISADTGDVLWEKSATAQHPMASTTKIMTALITIECSQQPLPTYCPRSVNRSFTLNETVEVGQNPQTVGGSLMNGCHRPNEAKCDPNNSLRKGERLTLLNLLHGVLLPSGNDAALAAAEFIACGNSPLVNSGTTCSTSFVKMMNARAASDDLVLENTRYQNPHGLDANDHFSSAYDLAKLARVALRNPTFAFLVQTFSYDTQSLEPTGEIKNYRLQNTNRLLDNDSNTSTWRYPGVQGVKTGTSKRAGYCLVSTVTLQGRSIIAVVLDSSSNRNRYQDSKKLLDYGSNAVVIPEFPLPAIIAIITITGSAQLLRRRRKMLDVQRAHG
ncbi:MAG TPA: hypothetical protein VJZ75_09210 [Candidatus Bathyarchaeia archaeon]|nr:hypothetical protein [Candidatus Bathyarchaeia archaeon]